MNKKDLSERDICTKYITPAVEKAGWDRNSQIREEVSFTSGRVIVGSKKSSRGEGKRADYILYYKPNLPLAVIEAKDNNKPIGGGMQKALEYARILDLPFAYSSNGDAFLEHDRTGKAYMTEVELDLDNFRSPENLKERYNLWKGITPENRDVLLQDYLSGPNIKKARYYQEVAINRAVEAIANGRNRLLLVMATGTGKTYVAFQIIYRLWKSRAKKRVLYLADRNILVDQAMNNDFKFFKDQGIITKIRNRKVDKSFEVYMSLYQAVTGNEDYKDIYKQFSPDFFDLVVVDECHRGSAREDAMWHEILEYFSSAAHIGMTATPKETKYVSNIHYFGEPIYTYSLKEGIEDGFLAPYKVIRISLDRDLEGWRPNRGQEDRRGNVVPDKIYNGRDFDRTLVIDDRTRLVAHKITEYLKNTDRFSKTIVFCTDIEHAERMRMALCNENPDLVAENDKYVMRITGDEETGKKELDNFIDPASKYPVIATTSKLLTTGVDVQTCKLIVLDTNIESMTEFKQIIGRGTRIREDYNKTFFTIMDFRGVTNHFADPSFDGEPVQALDFEVDQEIEIPEMEEESVDPRKQIEIDEVGEDPRKYYVDGVEISVVKERVQYIDQYGKLVTESLKDYTRKSLKKDFRSLDDFLQKWDKEERKTKILEELRNKGVLIDELREEVGKDYDEFDLICHVAFDRRPHTRKERVEGVKKQDYFAKYEGTARKVIDALLDKYADEGIEEIENMQVLSVNPFKKFGTPLEIVDLFGGKDDYLHMISELEHRLYPTTHF